jgi:hypothetical protein
MLISFGHNLIQLMIVVFCALTHTHVKTRTTQLVSIQNNNLSLLTSAHAGQKLDFANTVFVRFFKADCVKLKVCKSA